ncbi:unnamed protein product [Brassica oleracea]
METSQELNFINPLASKHEAEDPILRLSSSSSSSFSSCSSIEAEPRPDDQSPPTQIMERCTNNATSTPPYRIPPHVFEITTSTAPAEWSTLSNESLFSIHMGDNTFTEEIDYFKSGELTFPQPPSPRTPTLPSPPQSKNQGGASGAVEEVKTLVDIGKKADKAYHASKDQEQKAASSIRDVLMANKDNNNKTNKLDHSVSRRSEDFSVKSFAFPVIFPFLNAATSLTKLFLLANNMDGHVPIKELRDLTNLEVLDMSWNGFNDSIPIQDLSQNEFSGEIPVELGGLLKLHALNLSRNYLSGEIPRSFSGLKNVESLDLSFNRLHGEIPDILHIYITSLSSLGVFKVSYNNLSGVIPEGGHLSTFDANSYVGNPFLCGKPTNKSCKSNNIEEADNEVEDDEYTIDMVSFYWSLAAAYVTILLGVIASLSFDSPWSRAWFNMVDAFLRKVRNLFC